MVSTWTITNVLIQIVMGALGSHIARTAVEEYRLGFIWTSVVGLIAGAVSGGFLQSAAATVVTASGSVNDIRPIKNVVVQTFTGAAAGGMATLVAGFVWHAIREHFSPRG